MKQPASLVSIVAALALSPSAWGRAIPARTPYKPAVQRRDTCPIVDPPVEAVTSYDGSQVLLSPIQAAYSYSGSSESTTIVDESLIHCGNDSSTLLVTEGAVVSVSDSYIYKAGYFSDLVQSSFFGVDCAVVVANGSTATFTNTRVDTFIGGGGIYSYGQDVANSTVVYVYDSYIYSNASLSHALYASAKGIIHARNVTTVSNAYRSSAFAGDTGDGYLYINDSVATTYGIGSAIFYLLGEIVAHNVTGVAYDSPIIFSDGEQYGYIYNSDLTAGGPLGGMALFSSQGMMAGYVHLEDTVFRTVGATIPGIYVCSLESYITLRNVTFTAESGTLVTSNYSMITQGFDTYESPSAGDDWYGYSTVYNYGNTLDGDLAALNGSTIAWYLSESSCWTGAGNTAGWPDALGVYLDSTSTWEVTADSYVQNLTTGTGDLSSVTSAAGATVYYNASSTANAWLDGQSYSLTSGGKVVPYQ